MEYFLSISSSFILIISGINLSGIRMKLKPLIAWLVLISAITMFFVNFSAPIAGIIGVILMIIMFVKAKVKLIGSICYSVFSMLLCVICDAIIGAFIFKVFHSRLRSIEQLSEDAFVCTLFSGGLFLLVFSISKIIGLLIHKRDSVNPLNINNKFSMLIALSIVITFVVIYISAFLGGNDYDSMLVTVGMYIIYFILLMIVMYTLLSGYIKEESIKNKQRELEQLNEYTSHLEVVYNDMRKVRHDYMNVLASMTGYMDNDDMPGLIRFFDEKIIPFSNKLKENDFKLGLLSHLKQNEIKGIVSMKVIQAQEAGIRVFVDITEDIVILQIDRIDLCRIIGILLDNAIEAASLCHEGEVKIAFINKHKAKTIVVINSCHDDVPPIYQLYDKGFSTKGKSRGLGLSNLKEMTDSYSYVTLDTVVENNEFKQIVEILDK